MSKIGKLRQRLAFIHNIKPDTGHDLRQLEREVFQEPDISMVSGEKVWKPILNKKGEPELEGATSVENLSATHQYSEGGPNYMEPGGGDPKMRGLNYALEEKDWDEGRGGGLEDPDKRIPPSYVVGSEGDAGANTDLPNRLESGSEQRPWSDFAKREILRQRLDNAPLKKSRSLPKAMNTKREREEVMKRNITQENAVLWSKLKQRIAQVRLAYASPPKDVINAFRNKETLKMHAKKKGGGELSFQTDGKTLYQLSPDPPQRRYEIATWVDDGLEWSYENHPTPSTSQAGRMLGINTFTKDGKTFVDGKEVNPYSYDRTFVPNEHLQEGTVKVNPRAHVKKYKDYTPEEKQKIKDQDVFRQKANKQWKETKHLGGHIITDPDTGEIYDQAKIQPHEQKEINRILGYEKELPRESFVKDFHHANPVSKKSGPTGGIFDRVSPSGSVPLGSRGHAEAHDPAGTIPPSFRKRILKARLKIARIRQRNISRGVPRIAMGALARNVMQKAKGNPLFLTERTPVGYVYDEDNNIFLDATKRADAKAIREKHGKKGEWLGINSVTNTNFGKDPVLRNPVGLRQIERELNDIEDIQKDRPILGGYENSIEASYPVIGDEKTILSRLNKNQKSSLGIDPQGTAWELYPDGTRKQITKD